jgi:serine/threonine protein phosphatase PrpC
MQVRHSLRASGNTHPGLLRDTNEDRFHYDPARGIFIVVDGVGGQAAGEKAAEAALGKIRERLEEESGPAEERIRQAITNANNEIFRLASFRPEWKGMACVLTVAVVDGGEAVVGHVGDTRLYKIRRGRIEKLTKDHSPVGEREDAGEIAEADAMRHPRRNEVYRDVGSEAHRPGDAGFIDVFRVPFEADAALLLCSDGLTDLVDSTTIKETIEEYAGHAYEIVRALIDAANDAGGKDNITVVYVEGSRFADGEDTGEVRRAIVPEGVPGASGSTRTPGAVATAASPPPRWRTAALLVLLLVVIAWASYARRDLWVPAPAAQLPPPAATPVIVVQPGQSIGDAIRRAQAGTEVVVEPGEYRERLQLTSGIRVRSRVPRGASIRLPGAASEADAAIVALDVADAEVIGFRIVGDAATPLGTGVSATNASLTLTDVEISGAKRGAVVFGAGASGALLASDLHDNPGTAIEIKAGAQPRIAHNTFARNATSEGAPGWMLVEAGATPEIVGNTFIGARAESVIGPTGAAAASIKANNWFIASPAPPGRGARPGRRGGR